MSDPQPDPDLLDFAPLIGVAVAILGGLWLYLFGGPRPY